MVRFQSKTHLILWLEKNCVRPAIVRSLYEGSIEFFGGFNPVYPTGHPGWILRTTSIYGKVRYIAILAHQNKYGIRILKDIFWGSWAGSTAKNRTVLMNGDHPTEYLKLKEIYNEHNTK